MQDANVFIVRLWGSRGPQAGFRAAVQRAGTDESAWFTRLDALTSYFEQQAACAVREAMDAPAGSRSHGADG